MRLASRIVHLNVCHDFGLGAHLLDRNVPHYSITARQLRNELSKLRRDTWTFRDRAICLAAFGPPVISIIGLVVAAVISDYRGYNFPVAPWLLTIAASIAWTALVIYLSSLFSPSPTGLEYVKGVGSAPILILREFRDDRLDINLSEEFSFMDAIGATLRRYGPVVAIKGPHNSDKMNIVGYDKVSDDQWRLRVLEWMSSARIIVISMGLSPGLKWELDQLTSHGYLGKVVILRPPFEHFRARVAITGGRAHLRQEVSARLLSFVASIPGVKNLDERELQDVLALHFDEAGNTLCIKSCGDRRRHYSRALSLAAYGILSRR